jgi:hypothetical protein
MQFRQGESLNFCNLELGDPKMPVGSANRVLMAFSIAPPVSMKSLEYERARPVASPNLERPHFAYRTRMYPIERKNRLPYW